MKQQAIDILDEMMEEHKKVLKNEGMCDYDIDNTIRSNILNEAKSRISALGDGWIPVTERGKKGSENKRSLSVIQELKDGTFVGEYDSMGIASEMTGIDKTHISKCCRGKGYKSAGGYIWKFKPLPLPPNK